MSYENVLLGTGHVGCRNHVNYHSLDMRYGLQGTFQIHDYMCMDACIYIGVPTNTNGKWFLYRLLLPGSYKRNLISNLIKVCTTN